jgi:hypothetical protein
MSNDHHAQLRPPPDPYTDTIYALMEAIRLTRMARYEENPDTRSALLMDARSRADHASLLLRTARSPFGPVRAGLVTPGGAP